MKNTNSKEVKVKEAQVVSAKDEVQREAGDVFVDSIRWVKKDLQMKTMDMLADLSSKSDTTSKQSVSYGADFVKLINKIDYSGFLSEGSRALIAPELSAIVDFVCKNEDIQKVVNCGELSSAVLMGIAEYIPVFVCDTGYLSTVLKCATNGLMVRALAYGANYLLQQLLDIMDKFRTDASISDLYDSEEKFVKYVMHLALCDLESDSISNFDRACERCLAPEMNFTLTLMDDAHFRENQKDDYLLCLRTGLTLFLEYYKYLKEQGAYSAWKLVSLVERILNFTYDCDVYMGCSLSEFPEAFAKWDIEPEDYDGCWEDLSFELDTKGVLERCLKTEYEIRKRDVRVYTADFLKVLRDLRFDGGTLIVLDAVCLTHNELWSKYDVLVELMNSGAKFLMLCSDNDINKFEPAMKSLNFYLVKSASAGNSKTFIITNCDLPSGSFSTLPKKFRVLAEKNFKEFAKENASVSFSDDFDLSETGNAYTPLKEVTSLPFNAEYRGIWENRIMNYYWSKDNHQPLYI